MSSTVSSVSTGCVTADPSTFQAVVLAVFPGCTVHVPDCATGVAVPAAASVTGSGSEAFTAVRGVVRPERHLHDLVVDATDLVRGDGEIRAVAVVDDLVVRHQTRNAWMFASVFVVEADVFTRIAAFVAPLMNPGGNVSETAWAAA